MPRLLRKAAMAVTYSWLSHSFVQMTVPRQVKHRSAKAKPPRSGGPKECHADPANVGAVAFTRAGDPNVGEFSDAVVLKKFGDVPNDLSEL
jgi:hypothetical protein